MKIPKLILLFIGIPAYGFISGIIAKEEHPAASGGILYRSVFLGEVIPDAAVNLFEEPLRARLQVYRQRLARFQSRLPVPSVAREGPESYLLEKRRQQERAIAALIDRPGIESVASEYAQKAVLYYEWEGMSESPMAEASYAESYLQDNAASPLRPYLQLFLAHRWKCARETLIMEKKKEQASALQSKYQAQIILLRQNADPLICAVAEELYSQPTLYIDAQKLLAAERLLYPSADPKGGSLGPGLTIRQALDLAEKTLADKKLDVTGQFIHSIHLEYEDGKRLYPDGKNRRGFYWYVHWRWAKPQMGGELSMRIFMNGEILIERHGP